MASSEQEDVDVLDEGRGRYYCPMPLPLRSAR